MATIEELSSEPVVVTESSTNSPKVMRKGRMEVCQRFPEIEQAVEYNLLERRKDDKMLLGWKSYPGMADIISKARYMIDTDQLTGTEGSIEVMQGHES